MDRARVWPDFRHEDVLFEDADLLVVHKPAGVPSQAANPERPDDLVIRLRAMLAARDASVSPYLGVHQRLDRDTSGVVLFTRRPDANPAVARQFEGRGVKKRYLAAVRGWPRDVREATLDDDLRKGEDGRMEVAPRRAERGARARHGDPRSSRAHGGSARAPVHGRQRALAHARAPAPAHGAQRALTHVRVRAQRGDRALLELVLETGRTHQARVQLAHAGAPIAGDVLYGGAPAPRLMLHASSIELAHPRTGRRLTVRDERHAALEAWVERGDLGAAVYDDAAALDEALALAVERRWGLGRSADRDPPDRRTTAFRLAHEEGDALPALAVDVYGEHLVAQLHLGEVWDDLARRERVLDRLASLGFDGVYLKLRPRQANVLVDTRRDDIAPRAPVRGAPAPDELVVHEEGVPYRVRLGDGLSTGVFLDQRSNRRLVRELARGARVLNLFSYTCAFSVAAAVGGASRTTSVDASVVALERGRAGFEAAGVALGPHHAFAAEDAFAWLARAASKKERFDLVILDPPSYSSTKKRRFVAESDYGELVTLAARVLAPGGKILACCNHRGLSRSKLRRMVAAGIRAAGLEPVQVKDLPSGADFPPPPGREPQMKSVLATTRS